MSYLRTADSPGKSKRRRLRPTAASPAGGGRSRYLVVGVLAAALVVVVAGGVMLATARASLAPGADALATVNLPLGGGKIESVIAIGPRERSIPVYVRGDQIWPRGLVKADERVSVDVVVKRPGSIAWLSGGTERLHIELRTPAAGLRHHYLTLRGGEPVRLEFNRPVLALAYGPPGALRRHVLTRPETQVTLPRTASAGTIEIAGAPRSWETSSPGIVSWFPAGAATSAVANPAPGSTILPSTPITLTFSKPVSAALGSSMPPVSPATPGTWHPVNAHTIVFTPEDYGYGLGAKVSVELPGGVRLVGGQQIGSSSGGSWSVPPGSTTRLQQILALLGYLPLKFSYKGHGVGRSLVDQEAAAIKPPSGRFSWRYPNTPSALHGFWAPGASGVVTKGAVMAFENDHDMTADGVAGAAVWKALINADISGKRSTFGYTFVTVSEGSESLNLWHDGHTVLTTPVNTGIASAPTATGTFPVYEHLTVTTMSGTNPDGSHYSDPGIQWVSYFNGGDALHAFTRAQYGFPQSLGCVEMALDPASHVFPYTPIGTLVNVT